MPNTRSVTLTVELPADIADQAEEVAIEDPAFLARIVSYGLMRRIVYGHLRARESEALSGAGPGEVHLFAEARDR